MELDTDVVKCRCRLCCRLFGSASESKFKMQQWYSCLTNSLQPLYFMSHESHIAAYKAVDINIFTYSHFRGP